MEVTIFTVKQNDENGCDGCIFKKDGVKRCPDMPSFKIATGLPSCGKEDIIYKIK